MSTFVEHSADESPTSINQDGGGRDVSGATEDYRSGNVSQDTVGPFSGC